MRRHLSVAAVLVFVTAPAWAQGPTPPLPAPPPIPARPAAPTPKEPLPPLGLDMKFDMNLDVDMAMKMKDQALKFKDEALKFKDFQFSSDIQADVDRAILEAKIQAQSLADDARAQAQLAMEEARLQFQQGPLRAGQTISVNRDDFKFSTSDAYNSGMNALNQRQYDRAITAFDRVIAGKIARADAALYWKAFAQFKLSKADEALASIAQLRKDFPQSAYLSDARVLEADARRRTGQPVNPAAMDDDDIKLLAIQGIQKSPEAVPLLEGVLNATNSLAVKKRALYVLALSSDARARQILLRYAKGGGNPDLQIEAIRYLASRGEQQPAVGAELREIYEASGDVNVKMAVLEAYRSTSNKAALVGVASATAASADVRLRAISSLSGLASADEMLALYQKETDRNLRMQMLSTLGSMRATEQLAQLARSEKDTALRQRAIRMVGNNRVEQSRQLLTDLYSAEPDKEIKKTIINTMADQNNAEGLVALARKETAVDLKTEIVRRLADMASKSKPAADYLMETLK